MRMQCALKVCDENYAKFDGVEATVAMWNDFNGKHGSFADEYSTL